MTDETVKPLDQASRVPVARRVGTAMAVLWAVIVGASVGHSFTDLVLWVAK